VAAQLAERLSETGFDVGHLDLRELPPRELLAAEAADPRIAAAAEAVATADGVIVATPVYKASYTGLLKAFLDLLPQTALAGKTVLPVVTGGSLAHLLALDYALRPVLSALGARHVVPGCFLLDSAIERLADGGARLEPEAELRLLGAVDEFIGALPSRPALAPAVSS
jgi:FMN reductase